MTVAQLLETIGSRELTEWMAFYELEPWGEERADYRAGIVASTVANRHRGKNEKQYKPADFLPDFGQVAPAKQSRQEQMSTVQALAKIFGGEVHNG